MAHWKSDNPDADAGGRPFAEFDMGVVERAASIGCTNNEMAALLGVAHSTFYERLKQDPELQEVIDRGRETGKASLRRTQWAVAESGNPTMLIWLGKQWLDQKDKLENSGSIDTGMRVIVELVGDPAPAIEHAPQERRFTPRLVGDVEWKG